MKFLRLFKKYRELESECERLRNERRDFCKMHCMAVERLEQVKGELDIAKKELAEALAKISELSAAAPTPRPIKVPHCTTCPYHVRFNNAGKYAHGCNSAGCMISGNDTRTSPRWCPLRGNGEGEQA